MFAPVIKSERFTHAEFTNGDRYSDVAVGRDSTKPRRELDRGTKQVVIVVGDGFTRTNANTDMEGRLGPHVAIMNALLDGYRKGDGRHDGGEGCHYPVTGVFDLAPFDSG